MIHFSKFASPLRQLAATLSVAFAILVLASAASAASLDFNVPNGNYNVAGNWVDDATGSPPAAPPGYVDATTFDDAYVRNGGTVTINSDVSQHLLRIGASLEITPGDYNGDGIVDAADYVLWRNGGPLLNDPTPGVQPGDYTEWRFRFGDTTTQQIGQGGTLNWTAGKITADTGPIPMSGIDIATVNSTYYGPDIRVGQRDNTADINFTGTVNQNGASTEVLLLHSTSRLNIGDSGTTPNPTSTYNLMDGTIGLIIGYNIPFLGGAQGSNGNNGINVRNGTFNMTGGQIVDKTLDVANGNTLVDQRFMTISTTSGTEGNENVATANFTGGTVDVLGGLRAATSSNSRGYLNINGPVVMNVGGEVSIGYNTTNGVGEMNMSDGLLTIGTASNQKRLQIGHRGNGTLNLSGGSITVSGDLRVGAQVESPNSLINMTGGTLTTKQLQMQLQMPGAGGTPTILIDGPNAVFVQGPAGGLDTATIGQSGEALFEVRQGQATLNQVQLGNVNSSGLQSNGTINVKGGKLKITGPVLKSDPLATPTVNLTGGTLEITPNVVGAATWQTDLTNTGSKIVLNPNTVQQLTLSTTAGSATNSSFIMSSGSWDIEIGSNISSTGADRIIVSGDGTAELTGGTLNISLLPGYTPVANDTLRIVRALTGGVTLNAGAVTLAGAPNWSLITDVANTEIQLKYVGPGAGAGSGVETVASSIPEPSSVALLVLAVVGLSTAMRTRYRTSTQQN